MQVAAQFVCRIETHLPLLAPLHETMYGAVSLVASYVAAPHRRASALLISPAAEPNQTSKLPIHD